MKCENILHVPDYVHVPDYMHVQPSGEGDIIISFTLLAVAVLARFEGLPPVEF